MTGTLSAPLFVAAFSTSGIPRTVCVAFAVFCFYYAAYLVWSKERKERQRLADQIHAYPLLQIAPDGFHKDTFSLFHLLPAGQRVLADQSAFSVLRLRVINNPSFPARDSVAEQVRATIEFYTPTGERLATMDGRWADSPKQIERDQSVDFVTSILTVCIPIGQARDLDTVFKHPNEEECDAVNNDNFARGISDPRLPSRRLPKGTIIARVRLGINLFNLSKVTSWQAGPLPAGTI